MTDTQSTIRSVQCRAALKALREQFGYGIFDAAIRELNRERLQIGRDAREPRVRFKAKTYKILYHKQRGICRICNLAMVLPSHFPGSLEIDHINPNSEDFNDGRNLQLTHQSCNRKKGGKSVEQQSKSNGKTFADIVRTPTDEDGEPVEDELPRFLRKRMD
jgi:5-methylcytosine-specific restriction endonuclease McrA